MPVKFVELVKSYKVETAENLLLFKKVPCAVEHKATRVKPRLIVYLKLGQYTLALINKLLESLYGVEKTFLTACTKAYAVFRNAYIIAAPFVGTVGESEVYFLLPAVGIKLKYVIEKAGKLISCAEGTLITDYFYKRGYPESFGTLFYGYS